jgi:hypothetical protein
MEATQVKVWTKDEVRSLLERSDEAVWRGVVAIDNRQTSDERAVGDAAHLNGRGWGKFDAKFGGKMAELVRQWQRGESAYAAPLSYNQTLATRKLLLKYTRQLTEIANGVE